MAAISTAGGVWTDIEVLFISFQKFLLQYFPCLAAQRQQYCLPDCGTLRQSLGLTKCRSLYTIGMIAHEKRS